MCKVFYAYEYMFDGTTSTAAAVLIMYINVYISDIRVLHLFFFLYMEMFISLQAVFHPLDYESILWLLHIYSIFKNLYLTN